MKAKFFNMKRTLLLLSFSFFVNVSCGEQDHSARTHLSQQDLEEKYEYVDPQRMINSTARLRALEYYDLNYDQIENTDYLTIIDFDKHSSQKRFFIIDMRSGQVQAHKTAHGSGSDTNNDGYAERFSNTPDSHMSSIGFYVAAETYYSSKFRGLALRLDGLDATNSNARDRAIVIHPADYVDEDTSWTGRSWGCPALDPTYSNQIIETIKEGTIILGWSNQLL